MASVHQKMSKQLQVTEQSIKSRRQIVNLQLKKDKGEIKKLREQILVQQELLKIQTLKNE